jgi:hypothetical protein
MANNQFTKDPSAILDWAFDWKPLTHGVSGATSDWLATGETITDYTITADTGLTVDSSTEDAGVVTVWLSGGTVGEWYDIACKITTSAGRTDERTLSIQIQER